MKDISYILALTPNFLQINDVKVHHKKMKQNIMMHINTFKNNNKDVSDIVVIGSSCFVYMSYLLKGCLSDIDIHTNTLKENLKKTERIDIINNTLLASDYKKRIIIENGIAFLSKEDLIVNMIESLTKPNKINAKYYLQLLTLDCNMNLVRKIINNSYENAKIMYTNEHLHKIEYAIECFNSFFTDEYIQSKIGCQDVFYEELKASTIE